MYCGLWQAISSQAFHTKWGRHYLLSLARAHQQQQCNNFKDPGVQHYGGALFSAECDRGEAIFMALPAPTPAPRAAGYGGGGRGCTPTSTVDMSNYMNRCGGCIHGDCIVTLFVRIPSASYLHLAYIPGTGVYLGLGLHDFRV